MALMRMTRWNRDRIAGKRKNVTRFWRRAPLAASSASEPVQTFIVECYWPRISGEETWDIRDRLLSVNRAMPHGVRSMGWILVPSDGLALLLFSAPNEDELKRVGRLAEIPFDRIVESVLVGFGQRDSAES
jgi:hypothetical protein